MQCLTEYGVVHNSRRWSQSQAPEQGALLSEKQFHWEIG